MELKGNRLRTDGFTASMTYFYLVEMEPLPSDMQTYVRHFRRARRAAEMLNRYPREQLKSLRSEGIPIPTTVLDGTSVQYFLDERSKQPREAAGHATDVIYAWLLVSQREKFRVYRGEKGERKFMASMRARSGAKERNA